jgi:hypothetical protein
MSQPSIVEVEYQKFLTNLRRATDTKRTIEKSDKEAWMAYVRKHNVPESAIGVQARAGAMSGKTQAVIIDGAGASDGYYIYSSEDKFCLKYDLGSA